MTDQRSLSSIRSELAIPEKWQEKFIIKRIGEEDIVITLKTRDAILASLQTGIRFVQVGKYTLMLNAIKSIDPMWGEKNIPPRPKLKEEWEDYFDEETQTLKVDKISDNQDELDEYDRVFGERKRP